MINIKSLTKIAERPMAAFIILAVVYAFLIFTLPANKATMRTYSISALQYKAILLAVALPSILVWAAAFLGYTRLRQYANTILKTKDGLAFDQLARGVTLLAWSLPVSSIILLLLSALANRWASLHATTVVVGNYINLILPLIAFIWIGGASRSLISRARLRVSVNSSRVIMLLFVMAGVIYCYATFRQFDLSSLTSTNNPYFLPVWLAVITITVPYLYAWFVGLLAAYEIAVYNRGVKGVLYRQSLYLLVLGLVMVIFSLVSIQYLNGLSPRLGHLVINYKLPLTTTLKILGGAGFILIATGAVKLKKFEEV